MKKKLKFGNKILTALLLAGLLVFSGYHPALAAEGVVYTCSMVRLYQHPITGEIEDSGGIEGHSIAQPVIEGIIYPQAILEVTNGGEYYLTFRMSMMDYTMDQYYTVQTWGDSGWSDTAQGITSTGTDGNGTTADFCVQLPSENAVIRATMYVEPMGRSVIWFMYPDNFQEGNYTDLVPAVVTEAPAAEQPEEQQSEQPEEQTETQQETPQMFTTPDQVIDALSPAQTSQPQEQPANTQSEEQPEREQTEEEPKEEVKEEAEITPEAGPESKEEEKEEETASAAPALQVTEKVPVGIEETQTSAEEVLASADNEVIEKAKGLTLSTAGAAAEQQAAQEAAAVQSMAGNPGSQILVNTLSVLIPGLILILVGAGVLYFFRKNWYRWGHAKDDEED